MRYSPKERLMRMKKLINVISIATLMIFILSFSVFAGSIPEDLLHYDGAQIFFAEVMDSYKSPDGVPYVEVKPLKVIKGDVKVGNGDNEVYYVYYNPNTIGDFEVNNGNIYLFTYFDENNPTDIFEVTSFDTSTLKLKNVQGDMWKRFEQYLNNGDYEEAEQDRRERLGLLDEIMDEAEKLPPLENNSLIDMVMSRVNRNTFYIFILPTLIGIVLGICLWKIKKTYILSALMVVAGFIWWCMLAQINTHGSEGSGLLALMYSLISVAFVIIEAIKYIARRIKIRS